MNFFEHQEKARKKTGLLVFYFFLAVLCIFGVVAESLGGRLLLPNTRDLQEKRLLNVVEEMAIASGTSVPPVYLMDEKAINAFAAGYSPENAVIGVTRGCIEKLNRDQLQGVMAHEFSHILNGDMRMNIRLIGILHGILLLAGIGYFLMRIGSHSSRGRSREGGGLGVALLVGGLGMLVIGYVGSFFGGLIKAAVSRQREYLADASAVQFTRYPEGIAGALKRIGGFSEGSKVTAPNAAECSHMFFGASVASLFATHPPLGKRIRRIEPNWQGAFPKTDGITESAAASEFAGVSNLAGKRTSKPKIATDPVPPQLQKALRAAGNPTQEHVEHARQVIAETPQELLDRIREPFGARCVVYALLLDEGDKTVREKQVAFLGQQTESGTAEETDKAASLLPNLSSEQKFALVELASSALAHLSSGQYATFRGTVDHLAAADKRLDLFEWSLRKVIDHDLGRRFSPKRSPHGSTSARRLLPDCLLILGALARHGQDGGDPKPAFRAGTSALTRKGDAHLPSAEECGVAQLDEAVNRLERLTPLDKQALLEACERTIAHDGKATDVEVQILRGLAAGLSCPLPPATS